MNTLNDIFGTFRPLTPAQMKGNAQFVALWSASLLIVLVGVVAAVRTGIVWIGVVAGGIWMGVIFLLANNRKVKYVPKFGVKYNLLRFLIGGYLVYSGAVWRGLLGCYCLLAAKEGWEMSLSAFGWTLMTTSLAITLISKWSLYRMADVQVADLVGVIEMTALAVFIGSIMFLLLYT